MTTTTKVG